MSVPRGYGLNGKSIYQNITMPKDVWCQFTVNAADSGGLGVTSVKSNGYIEYVFMHTSQTPGAVNGYTNPNPGVGYAVIKFKNNFNKFLGLHAVQNAPLTSTSATSVTANSVYSITALGTATLAQWQAVGLLPGFTPAVGQTFVATASQSIGGSATVGSPGVLLAPTVTVIGTPNTLLNNSQIAVNSGAVLVVQFSGPSAAGTTTLVAKNPADGTIVAMKFSFDGSSVSIGTGGL